MIRFALPGFIITKGNIAFLDYILSGLGSAVGFPGTIAVIFRVDQNTFRRIGSFLETHPCMVPFVINGKGYHSITHSTPQS